jgi:Zn-dependent protease with chaperone function
MKQLILLLTALVLTTFGITQESNYTGLKSKGAIPDDFTKLTLQKIEEAKKESEETNRITRKTKSKFYEISNFGVDQLLQSGSVCFNDTISSYVDNVMDEIRMKNRSIPLDIRVYTIKSPVVNAFTTDQGIIFINTGLLAQLENEAQLAFVLCHEIIHYMEGHVMEGFIEETNIRNNQNDYRRIKTVDKELASARFSRKMEVEADKKGLKLFLNTDYNPAEVDGVFDVLLYSYLPFDEIHFDSSILEIGKYEIPDKFFLEELNEIEVEENIDDSRHTHPNIAKRRKTADNILISEKQTGKNFLVSEKDFYAVRAAARYEVLRLQLINGKYSEALYSALILQKEFPENPLPKTAIAEILYGTALFANSKNRKKVTGYYKKKQGNIQQSYYLLNKLKGKDLTILAARYNYYLHELYPDNETINKRMEILFRDLVYYYEMSVTDLEFYVYDKSKRPNKEDQSKKTTSVKKVTSKYDKIKSNKKKKAESNDFDKYWANALFAGCNCENEIETLFEIAEENTEKLKYQLGETDDDDLNAQSAKEKNEYQKIVRRKGRSLGIDKIVMVDPYYAILNYGKKEAYKQVKSEKEEVEQLDKYEKLSTKANLDLEILTSYRFKEEDVQKYNDFSLVNEWANERFMMEDRTNITSSTEEVADLVERYNTKYFAWSGVVNTTYPRSNKFYVALLSAYTIVGIPFGIYYVVTPKKATTIYFALFNIETGKLVMYEERTLGMNDSNGVLDTHFYDIFNQIKK